MKKYFFILSATMVLSMGIVSESRAVTCGSGKKVCGTACINLDDGCNCYVEQGDHFCEVIKHSCGNDCSWIFDKGVLSIYGSGNMDSRDFIGGDMTSDSPFMSTTFPWDEYRDTITAVEIDGISNVGEQAFDSFTNLKSVTLGDSVKTIKADAFNETAIESLDLSNVETLDEWALEGAHHLKHVIMPDDISNFATTAFAYSGLEDCLSGECGTCNNYTKSGTGCVTDCGEGYTANAEKQCIKNPEETPEIGEQSGNHVPTIESCYANGQVFYKEQCWDEFPFSKKKWTPAEAAQWLNEDDNTVTITFKK